MPQELCFETVTKLEERGFFTWPTGDLGVRRGWEKIYSLDEAIAPKALEIVGEKFSPYRSVIAWYCWQDADAQPQLPSNRAPTRGRTLVPRLGFV